MLIGQTISHYKITEKIGEGGMGEVYRATDTKLNRDVALKVLPEAFVSDRERMARFSREAQVLASLNHPNIASIYGLEDSDNKHALVLELVEGETLAERISRGAVPLEESLKIALQIAEGLEAAHEKGIIHRDLKPANVKITPEGKVKVLDFGLAKALEDETPATDLTSSPTRTGTAVGVIMGAAGYMSPEQARGKPVDKRTDIWAFGCVLYEALTSGQVFGGETVTDILAAVVGAEPDWERLPPETPIGVRHLLRRCLTKDPHQRLHDIADARIELDDTDVQLGGEATLAAERAARATSRPRELVAWSLALAAAALSVWIYFASSEESRPSVGPVRFSLNPRGFVYGISHAKGISRGLYERVAVSPDGSRLAFVAVDENGATHIWVRSFTHSDSTRGNERCRAGVLVTRRRQNRFPRARWALRGSERRWTRATHRCEPSATFAFKSPENLRLPPHRISLLSRWNTP